MIKYQGIIVYSKKIKDNDLFLKILSKEDQIHTGMVYGGNSSKKKLIYQNGYFIDYTIVKKNINSPPLINAEISYPYLSNIIDNKYKLNALLSILSLINISILEGQTIKGFYISVLSIILHIIEKDSWIIFYCEWLFHLLKLIGYQVDYEKNIIKNNYDLVMQEFISDISHNSINFPHIVFNQKKGLNFKNINSIFIIFESIFTKNHLDNMNYKMPTTFLEFKKIILKELR
tara:strand:- start:134 stop:826 length:693 start_codon:yes stop_codon:yes gene_type:complete